MKKVLLNGLWNMRGNGYDCSGQIPGSVYSFLLSNGLIDDLYYRDNEIGAFELVNHPYEFYRCFDIENLEDDVYLCFDGLDTLAEIVVNGRVVANTKNMHRSYRFLINDYVSVGQNRLKITFSPVDNYIKERDKKCSLHGSLEPLKGYGHIRKAHCMLGWDWGPCLPDMGIWRDVYILYKDGPEITEFSVEQEHIGSDVYITPNVIVDKDSVVTITITDPSGNIKTLKNNKKFKVIEPMLWWPRGLGEQPLYKVKVEALVDGIVVDSKIKRIGLRTLELIEEEDCYGRSFYHKINGVSLFAMGADYIPMDNVLSRITRDRLVSLLNDCAFANFNTIRVWGGGYYPEDDFFDLCDEQGFIVFLDLMFACSMYDFDDEMREEVKEEIVDNITRISHHACLGVISGNNEIETIFSWMLDKSDSEAPYKKQYIEMFEKLIPDILKSIASHIPYISSSPSSFGSFVDPDNENYGDSHYWKVWHAGLPFSEYRQHYFRYLSEFGLQSFPCMKTIESFTQPKDRNIFSYVMDKHQRNGTANGKIMAYMAQTFLYPTDFETLLYASQLLQAEAMKYAVEHLRRNRSNNRCMGALYWQLNDIWPVASWSSIDYYGRYKALHYYARRFFSPIAITVEERGEHTERTDVNLEYSRYPVVTSVKIAVHNDTREVISGVVEIELSNTTGERLDFRQYEIKLSEMNVQIVDEISYPDIDYRSTYLAYRFIVGGKIVSSGTTLFTSPKYFAFENPRLSYRIEGDKIIVKADSYAKAVEITADEDIILEDNYFDMQQGEERSIKLVKGTPSSVKLRSVFDIR